MGQISYPILNRFGYSMYWNGMWDNLQQYSRFFLKNLFLNEFLSNFFNFYLTVNYFFFSNFFRKNIINGRQKFQTQLSKINVIKYRQTNNNYIKFLKKSFSGRVWVFFFNTWCITSVFIYSSKFKTKRIQPKTKKANFSLFFLKLFVIKNNYNYFNKNKFFQKATF